MKLAAHDITVGKRLSGVTAALEPGKVTAICGPNGAGKSTLLQCLAGLIRPDSGSVTFAGTGLAAMHPRARAQAIGYLPQTAEIAWDLSVRNLVALGRLPFADRGAGEVEAALSVLDLGHLADRPVSTLSGGERARALLARAVAGTPRWLLADEPLSALDLKHQMELVAHARRMAGCGTGVVLVVHDLSIAMNHADRVIVLSGGRLSTDGDPESALASEVLEDVWRVPSKWVGEPGKRALVVAPGLTGT